MTILTQLNNVVKAVPNAVAFSRNLIHARGKGLLFGFHSCVFSKLWRTDYYRRLATFIIVVVAAKNRPFKFSKTRLEYFKISPV